MCHVCQKCAFVLSSTAQQEECSNVLQCPKSNYSSQFVKFFTRDKNRKENYKIVTSTDLSIKALRSEKGLFKYIYITVFRYSLEEGQYEIKKPIDLLIIATKRLL